MSCDNVCFFLYLRLTLFYMRLQKFLNCPAKMTARIIDLYRNIQHHVHIPLIVTTVARCFSPFTAKCNGFHCQTAWKIPVLYGMHFSARCSAAENQRPCDIVWRYLRDPTFSRFSRTPTCDRQTDGQTHDDS